MTEEYKFIFYVVAIIAIVAIVGIVSLVVATIYLREVISLKGKTKINGSDNSVETELVVTSLSEKIKNELSWEIAHF